MNRVRCLLLAAMAAIFLLFTAISCSIAPSGAGSVHLVISMPASKGSARAFPEASSRIITPGTASFLIIVEGDGLSTPLERTVEAPAEGGSADVTVSDIPYGPKTITIVARDSNGNAICSGTTTVDVGSTRTDVSLELTTLNADSAEYAVAMPYASIDLESGEVRVIEFTAPADDSGYVDYSISIMYSPCLLSVYDSDFQPISLVGGTAEKWALVTEDFQGDTFYIVISNATGAARSVELRLERAYYCRYFPNAATSGTGARAQPFVSSSNFYGTVVDDFRPVRYIMAGTENSYYPNRIDLQNGESIYGGFDPSDWSRDLEANQTRISFTFSNSPAGIITSQPGVTNATVVDGLMVDCGAPIAAFPADNCGIDILYGNPIITNNEIRGPDIDPNFTDIQSSTGIDIDPNASDGIVIAFNRVLGGRLINEGSLPNGGDFYFYGVSSDNDGDYSRLIAGNEIVGLTSASGMSNFSGTISVYALYAQCGSDSTAATIILNNTIDAGRINDAGWDTLVPTYYALFVLDNEDPGPRQISMANNLLGSFAFHPFSSYSYAFYPNTLYGAFDSNFLFRADSTFPLDYPTMPSVKFHGPVAGYGDPSDNGLANASLFPPQSGDFGDHHLTGAYPNNDANPATCGARPESLAYVASLSDFEKDFLLWDREGRRRTVPCSVGCYERD